MDYKAFFSYEDICDIRVSLLSDIRVNEDNPYLQEELNRLKAIIRKLDSIEFAYLIIQSNRSEPDERGICIRVSDGIRGEVSHQVEHNKKESV